MAALELDSLRELYRQLALSPAEVRRGHVNRLEDLLLELEPDREYPYEYLFFRMTGFRPGADYRDTFHGREVLPELVLVLEKLSRGAARHVAEIGETVYTTDEAAEACGVSPRTIHRWRRRGLICRRYVFPDGRTRMGIRHAALDRFIEQNRKLAARSKRFARLSGAEEEEILRLARRLALEEGLSLSAAAARISEKIGGYAETVRLILKRHAREHPGDAPFVAPRPPHEPATRRRIYQQYRQGTPVEELCRRHSRSRQTIYRLINAQRAAEFLDRPADCVQEDDFDEPGAEEAILDDAFGAMMDSLEGAGGMSAPPSGRWWESRLSEDAEHALFQAYNFTRYQLAARLRELQPRRYVPSRLLGTVEALIARADRIKAGILRAHLPLAEHVAWQHAGDQAPSSALVEQGRAWLGELVDSFDHRRGSRFPNYATLELLKRFARTVPPARDDQ